ncbi:uncharacterized protein BKA55DRAFT_719407, partial [Fusarium redolens]
MTMTANSPSSLGESTTLSRVAYESIAQQNMTGIDISDMEIMAVARIWAGDKAGRPARSRIKMVFSSLVLSHAACPPWGWSPPFAKLRGFSSASRFRDAPSGRISIIIVFLTHIVIF